METHEIKALKTSLSYHCLYSLMVSKGLITKEDYINHSILLRDVAIKAMEQLPDSEDVIEVIKDVYVNIANSAK